MFISVAELLRVKEKEKESNKQKMAKVVTENRIKR